MFFPSLSYWRSAFLLLQLPVIQKTMEDAGQKILTPLLSLDTPGKATVEVVILADPVSAHFPLFSLSQIHGEDFSGYSWISGCRYLRKQEKMGMRCILSDFSPLRIQTFTWSHPCKYDLVFCCSTVIWFSNNVQFSVVWWLLSTSLSMILNSPMLTLR